MQTTIPGGLRKPRNKTKKLRTGFDPILSFFAMVPDSPPLSRLHILRSQNNQLFHIGHHYIFIQYPCIDAFPEPHDMAQIYGDIPLPCQFDNVLRTVVAAGRCVETMSGQFLISRRVFVPPESIVGGIKPNTGLLIRYLSMTSDLSTPLMTDLAKSSQIHSAQ